MTYHRKIFLSRLVGVFFIGTLAIMSFYPTTVSACSCAESLSPEEAFANASAVFAGKVIGIEKNNTGPVFIFSTADPVRVTFNVSESWKGISDDTVSIISAEGEASCGYEFKEGKEYIVYAYDTEDGLGTGLCSRTALLTDADEDHKVLGSGAADTRPLGTAHAPYPVGIPPYAILMGGVALLLIIGGTLFIITVNKKK